jgi:DNA primase
VGTIPEHVVDEIRERADVVEVVGRHVTLRKAGHRYWGLCPFHSEKTPSFSVHSEKQIFYCFGCGAHGDVFGFRMRHESATFPEVVRALAQELGIAIPASGPSGSEGRSARLQRANEVALEYFRASLRGSDGRAARAYLERRGSPVELIERFQIGFAPAGWDGLVKHLRAQGVDAADAETAGLIARRQTGDGHYDRFRARVIFPILEPGARIVGFGGRALDDETPKYLNTPESPLYRKGRVLFGLPLALDAIRERDRAIVVEGYFDAMALHQAGLPEAVAPCGTALTQEHARRIRRYTRETLLLFDGDEAGQRAAERALPVLLSEGLRVRAAFLPAGADPDDLVRKQGPGALRAVVDAAVPLLDELVDRKLAFARGDAWTASDRLQQILPLLQALPDPIERARWIRDLGSRLEIGPEAVQEALRRLPESGGGGAGAALASGSIEPPSRSEVDATARDLLSALTAHPELVALLDGRDPALDPAQLVPSTAGRTLLARFLQLARVEPDAALARLLSPPSEDLSVELKQALTEIVTRTEPSLEQARQAVSDCLAKLEQEALQLRHRDLSGRLKSCNETAQVDSVLEEMQQLLERKRQKDRQQRPQAATS